MSRPPNDWVFPMPKHMLVDWATSVGAHYMRQQFCRDVRLEPLRHRVVETHHLKHRVPNTLTFSSPHHH